MLATHLKLGLIMVYFVDVNWLMVVIDKLLTLGNEVGI